MQERKPDADVLSETREFFPLALRDTFLLLSVPDPLRKRANLDRFRI